MQLSRQTSRITSTHTFQRPKTSLGHKLYLNEEESTGSVVDNCSSPGVASLQKYVFSFQKGIIETNSQYLDRTQPKRNILTNRGQNGSSEYSASYKQLPTK